MRQTQRAAANSNSLQNPKGTDKRKKGQSDEMHELVFEAANTVS
jgi:hypothetical protein